MSLLIILRSLEGTCHGAGEIGDKDNGAPTYFRLITMYFLTMVKIFCEAKKTPKYY